MTKVSIIIPAYNNAEYLDDAIQSVLNQTYPNVEVIVVNDASPDNVNEVVSVYTDPRVKLIVHEQNRGLSAARNTGIKAAEGEIISLLDGDDYFHPEKFQRHVEFLTQHPEVGVTYNPRFELNHSVKTIRELWRPPLIVNLADLVFSYPFSPSDMVLRREWIFQIGLFDEYHHYVGEDLDINCRLGLAGCKFASVDRALNYRRYHSGRVIKNLRGSVEDTMRPLDATFADPRCSQEALAIQDKARANHYMLWSVLAFAQDDIASGQEYCLTAIKLNPTILSGQPCALIGAMIAHSIADESLDHVPLLRKMFYQLPLELRQQREQVDWAVARATLLRGVRAMIWGRIKDGHEYFGQATALNAQIDELFLQNLTARLLDYQIEFGSEASQEILRKMSPYLEKIGERSQMRWLKGFYSINQAFHSYRVGNYAEVPKEVFQACTNDPKYLTNRGVLSILFRSLVGGRLQSEG